MMAARHDGSKLRSSWVAYNGAALGTESEFGSVAVDDDDMEVEL